MYQSPGIRMNGTCILSIQWGHGARILQDSYCPLLCRFIWQNGEEITRYASDDSVGGRCKVFGVDVVAFWTAGVNGDVDDDDDDDDDDEEDYDYDDDDNNNNK